MGKQDLLVEIEKLSFVKQLSLIKELFISPSEKLFLAAELFPESLSFDSNGQYIILTGILKGSEEK